MLIPKVLRICHKRCTYLNVTQSGLENQGWGNFSHGKIFRRVKSSCSAEKCVLYGNSAKIKKIIKTKQVNTLEATPKLEINKLNSLDVK